VDILAVVPFTPEFAAMPADDFVLDLLCDSLGMRHIVIGHDYAFGKERAGNFETLERIGAGQGFTVEYMEPVGHGDEVFSSSLARRLVLAGDMEGASRILGRYHLISGTVVHGREIGQSIGFPTANIASANELLPPDGVYAVMVSVEGLIISGACNIGQNPTFAGRTHTIEVFLLDFDGRIYGQSVVVWFVQRLRAVRRFDGVPALVAAIERDVLRTREILAHVDSGLIEPSVGKALNEIEA
jgi:riboflavin kinase/FMN adenylyltransferase